MNDQPSTTQPGFVPGAVPGDPLAQELAQRVNAANVKRGIELGEYTLSIFKTTLGHTPAFKEARMNNVVRNYS